MYVYLEISKVYAQTLGSKTQVLIYSTAATACFGLHFGGRVGLQLLKGWLRHGDAGIKRYQAVRHVQSSLVTSYTCPRVPRLFKGYLLLQCWYKYSVTPNHVCTYSISVHPGKIWENGHHRRLILKSWHFTLYRKICNTSSPLSPLIALATPIWCLFRTRRSPCPRWCGCPSWSRLRVSRACCLSQRSKGLTVEGLISQGTNTSKLLLLFVMKIVANINHSFNKYEEQ